MSNLYIVNTKASPDLQNFETSLGGTDLIEEYHEHLRERYNNLLIKYNFLYAQMQRYIPDGLSNPFFDIRGKAFDPQDRKKLTLSLRKLQKQNYELGYTDTLEHADESNRL